MKMKKLFILNLIALLLLTFIPSKEYAHFNFNTSKQIQGTARIIDFEKMEKLDFDYNKNLLEKSYIQEKTLAKAFKGTKMQGLEKYFIQAEEETGINALYLAGLAAHESAWNTSKFAKERNNLFGWQAYDNNLNATKKFESKKDCILFVAKTIKKTYLTENGIYHSGYTMESISKRYASDKQHSQKIYKIIQKMIDKIEK